MSAVLAVVDISFALHTLCVGIKSRIDAAKALPQTANRCSRLVDQIDGMIDGCNVEDKRTRVILDNIKKAMEELDALLVKINKKIGDVEANSSGCCVCLRLASKGKDALAAEDELERTESELRAHVDALVNASLIHKHASRTSNKLSQADARRFWDEYFGEEREVSVENLAEALRHECEVAGAGVDAETCAAVCRHCFGAGGGSVTVLSFGDVFNLASIQDTMKSLAKRAKAAQRLFTIQVYDYATKRPDENVDAGFMMCRATDSLKVLRALVCGHALSLGDEESTDDDEFEFEGDEIDEGATRSDAAPPRREGEGEKARGDRGSARSDSAGVSLPRARGVHVLPGRVQNARAQKAREGSRRGGVPRPRGPRARCGSSRVDATGEESEERKTVDERVRGRARVGRGRHRVRDTLAGNRAVGEGRGRHERERGRRRGVYHA